MKLFRLYGSQDFWTIYYKGERGIGNKGIKDEASGMMVGT